MNTKNKSVKAIIATPDKITSITEVKEQIEYNQNFIDDLKEEEKTDVFNYKDFDYNVIIEDLERENERLKKQLQSIPQTLEERLNYLKEKNAQAKQLSIFSKMLERIDENIINIEKASIENPFTVPNDFIVFQTKANYRSEDFLTIQNPIVLIKTYEFVKGILTEEIVKLQTLINS